MFSKILVICAHPDDDILGCGATLAKYHEKGAHITVCFLAEGSSCRYTKSEIASSQAICAIEERKDAAKEALNLLGVDEFHFYDFPCGRLDTIAMIDLGKCVEQQIMQTKPDLVLTHSTVDANYDHRLTSQAVLQATRPGGVAFVPYVIHFEILSSTEWRFDESFKPNYFEALQERHVEKKIQALNCYRSEIKPHPHPRNEDMLRMMSKVRGSQCNVVYAEAFSLLRGIVQ